MLLGRRTTARTIAVWLAVSLLMGSVATLGSSPTKAAFVPLQPSDALVHAPRGDADGVYRFAEAVGSARLADVRAYVDEVYRLAPLVGLDPAVLIGQSALETGYWKGKFWLSDLNPAGIGITRDDQPTSFHWATGADAARGHIYHLYVYAVGIPPAGHLLDQYRALDPRAQSAVGAGYAGTKTTIQSLEGSWATMALYAQGLCNKANEILGYAERTTTTPTRTRTATPTATATTTPTATATPRPATPTLVLSKTKSKYNGAVVASVSGFSPGAVVALTWPDGRTLNTAVVDGTGAGVVAFRTPLAPYGSYRVEASDASGRTAAASLAVIPRILLNETSGPTTTRLRVYFYGFAPGERVEFRWYAADGTAYAVVATVAIADNGRGSSLVTIPSTTGVGTRKVVGRVVGVARSASTTFTVTADAAAGGIEDPTASSTGTPVAAAATGTATVTATAEAASTPTTTPTATPTPIPTPASPSASPTLAPSATVSATASATPTSESFATVEPTATDGALLPEETTG